MKYILEKKIEEKREEMVEVAKEFGIESKETLEKSSELDHLILEYQNKYR